MIFSLVSNYLMSLSIVSRAGKKIIRRNTRGKLPPYNYNDFDDNAKSVIQNVANMLSAHYKKNYDVTTAHGIESDGCADWLYIGFNDSDGVEDFFLMNNFDHKAVLCDEFYAMQHGDIKHLEFATMAEL